MPRFLKNDVRPPVQLFASQRTRAGRQSHVSLPLLVLLFASISGCSSLNLDSAVKLATAGQSAANAYKNSIQSTKASINQYVEGLYLTAPLTHNSPPDQNMLQSIAQVQTALSKRAAMMGALADVYTQFGALASYDAKTEMSSSISSLDTAANSFASVVHGNSIPNVADTLASQGGGMIGSEIQKRKVKAASEAIRTILLSVVDSINKEKDILASIQTKLAINAGQTAVDLWENGIGSPDPILADNIGTFGLQYVSGDYKNVCTKLPKAQDQDSCITAFRQAIANVVQTRADREIQDQSALINSNIAAIQNLAAAHKQLEEGEPVDVSSVTQEVQSLNSLVTDVNKSLTPQTATK
jgi:hypothetical protein